MKNIFFCLAMVSALFLNSCEKNFDPNIYGSLSSANFPATEKDLEAYLMGCYRPFMNFWGYTPDGGTYRQTLHLAHIGINRMFDSPSDLGEPWLVGAFSGNWISISQSNFNNMNTVGRASNDGNPSHFEFVREVTRNTEVIGTIERIGPSIMEHDPARLQHLIGEARLLRGLLMYYLFHIFGPVPVIVDPAFVGSYDAEANLVRPTITQMTTYIYDDFEFAVRNMSPTSTVRGRYNGDFARFLLMRHCLNEGGHMPGYYDKAIEMFEELKAGARYSLFTTGGEAAYANLFKQNNKWNSEIIMAVHASIAGTGSANAGDFNPFMMYALPTNLFKEAVLPNGEANPFSANETQSWGQVYNISPTFYDTFEDGDTRKNSIVTHYFQNNAARTLHTRETVGTTWSGFIINKFPIEINQRFQPTDVPLARWADVLLMYAEAVARKNQAVPAQDVLNETVNAVRSRAMLAPLSGDAIASFDSFMDALLMERAHELYYEGNRKVDLIRFNKYRYNITKYKTLASWDYEIRQYFPIPNFAVLQAEEYGKTLSQWFTRPEWEEDKPYDP